MSWAAILGLAAGCYAMKAVGPVALAGRDVPGAAKALLALLAVPLLAALIAVQALTHGKSLVVDARLAGLAVAGLLVWRRAPFIVVVLAAAATAALLRAVA